MLKPLFFPDSEFIKNKWWHKLAAVFILGSYVLSLGLLIASIYNFAVFDAEYNPIEFKLMVVDYANLVLAIIYSFIFLLISIFLSPLIYKIVLNATFGHGWRS